MLTVTIQRDYSDWRTRARELLARQLPPEQVFWQQADDAQLLLGGLTRTSKEPSAPSTPIRVPKAFADLAHDLFHHRNPDRFSLLYRILWRLTHGERNLLNIEVDDDIRQATVYQRQVRWDAHRMNGFVRFEKVADEEGELFLAWYKPDHYVLKLVAGDFARRFADMRWSILTPDDSAHWNRQSIAFGPGVPTRPKTADQLVSLWQTYYAATYNPMRHNPRLQRQHVPTRFLQNLPEARAPLPPPKRYTRQ